MIAKALAGPGGDQARALLIDLPDHGRSPWSSQFSYAAYADAVAATLLAHAPGERWTLVGHSLGGKTAMLTALQYPEILDITKKTEANFDGVNKLKTFNYMLKGQPSYRKGVDGLQTGTTDLAGASFVAHSNESGMSIITVIINAEHTDTDDYAWFTATNELLNYVVYHWESKTIAKKGQAISKSQVDVLDGKSKQVSAVAKSDFNIIQKIDANNNKHIKVTTNQIQSPVKSGDKVGTATFEDRTLVGDGYLPNQGMPSMELVAGKEVKKSFFLKVWWNHFVTFVNEKL